MSGDLPSTLRAALDRELEGVSRTDLAKRTEATTASYRSGGVSAPVIRDWQSALAYAVARMPATYAACAEVMGELARMAPEFRPASLLDAGAGPGTASWAALETFATLRQVTLFDANALLLDLGERLATDGPAALAAATRTRGDLLTGSFPAADLVIASYALAEIAPSAQAALVSALWTATDGALALAEPGTPAGYARLMQARDRLIAEGAVILAPCPHAATCPIQAPDWCHFSVRLPRSRDHRQTKGADAPFEDEKFAYLLAGRPQLSTAPRAPRILARPQQGKPGVTLKLCGQGGIEPRMIGRRDRVAYAAARRLGWGDVLRPVE